MAYEYRATRREIAERYFTCERCGARGEVIFQAVGTSAWVREGFFQENAILKAEAQSEADLFADAARTLDLVKCPTCGRRARGAIAWACVRVAAWMAIGTTYAVFTGNAAIVYAIAAIPTLAFGWREVQRARRARRAVITKLEPGKLPDRERAKPRLPEARALAVPEAAPRSPPPVAQPPPPPPAPLEPGAEPTLLRDRDGES